MSNIYITEPPPSGKVILDTSRGEIEIELFADQCPLACKNFIALALEGYYDNLVWHRYVADFVIQSGDPTGTGIGGESFYGHEFDDEPHQRLRFNRRGLLGMANGSDRNTNGSQFFLTLSATPELQNKHTMFGRISGKTVYNLIALAESVGELHPDDDRPLFPPKLKTIRVIDNPFEGQLQLRITRQEKLAILKNKRDAEERKRMRGGAVEDGGGRQRKKNTALLSFDDVDEGDDDNDDSIALKGPKSSHDLLKNDRRLRPDSAPPRSNGSVPPPAAKPKSVPSAPVELRVDGTAADAAILKLESSIRGLSNQSETTATATATATAAAAKHVERGRGKDLLASYRAQYMQMSGKTKKRDDETESALKIFQSSLRNRQEKERLTDRKQRMQSDDDGASPDMREYGADGDEEEQDWRCHRFDAGGTLLNKDVHDTDEYILLDPRDSASSAAIQLGFGGQDGQQRAQQERARQGRRGRDWIDDRSSGGGAGGSDGGSRCEKRSRQDVQARQSHWRSEKRYDDKRPR